MRLPLNESATAQADASGNAIVRMTPGVSGSSWKIKRMVTSVAGVNPRTIVNLVVYRNVISETNRLDGTTSAAQDASETDIDVSASDTILGVYSDCPVGSFATLAVSGYKETGRR